ncbi:MAG: acyl carrier protein [Labilithrix sp.]
MISPQVIEERVLSTVKRAIAESLAVGEGEITLQSRLVDDLGADSLDFVDIVFMLDRELDIRVRETEFNFLTRLDFSSPEVMAGAHLTGAVVERLSSFLPALASVEDKTKITPRQLFSLITVESICIVCQQALAARK